MRTIVFPPFRRPSRDAVVADGWYLVKANGPIGLPEMLKEWDYNEEIVLTRACTVDSSKVRSDCELGPLAELFLAVVYHTSGGRDKVCALRRALGDTQELVTLEVRIPGVALAGQLHLQTQVVVGDAGLDAGSLAPSHSGSILWEDAAEVDLDGVGSRFPVHECDFASDLALPSNAAWHLDVDDGDPDASFTQCVCLYINSSKPRVVAAGKGASIETEGRAIAELMYYDLARSLVQLALENPGWYDDSLAPATDSLRATVRRLIRSLLDVSTFEQLRGLSASPSEMATRIQGRLNLLST